MRLHSGAFLDIWRPDVLVRFDIRGASVIALVRAFERVPFADVVYANTDAVAGGGPHGTVDSSAWDGVAR